MLINRNNKGFTAIEAAIAAGAIALVVIIGIALYSHDHTPQAIILNRQKAIDSSVKHLSINNYSSIGSSLYSKGLITTSLYNIIQSLTTSFNNGNFGSNPYSYLICVQQQPTGFTYGPVSLSSPNAGSINVNVFTSGSLSSVPYKVNWVDKSGSWQLNSVSCH